MAVPKGDKSYVPTGVKNFTDKQEKLLYMIYKNEGGYTYLPGDSGQETYRGIARAYHPDWSGWKTIDKLKAEKNVSQLERGTDIPELQNEVYQFYYDTYYKPMHIDDYKDVIMAGLVLHRGVGMGSGNMGKLVTRAVNKTFGKGYSEPGGAKCPTNTVFADVNGDRSADVTENFVKVAMERYLEIDNAKKKKDPNYPGYYKGWCNSIYKDIAYLKANFS